MSNLMMIGDNEALNLDAVASALFTEGNLGLAPQLVIWFKGATDDPQGGYSSKGEAAEQAWERIREAVSEDNEHRFPGMIEDPRRGLPRLKRLINWGDAWGGALILAVIFLVFAVLCVDCYMESL